MIQEIKRPQQKVLPNRFDINNINTTDLPTTQRIINNRAASVASSLNSEDDEQKISIQTGKRPPLIQMGVYKAQILKPQSWHSRVEIMPTGKPTQVNSAK